MGEKEGGKMVVHWELFNERCETEFICFIYEMN